MRRRFLIGFFVVALASCAPRSNTLVTYDQKQTGDYNIQLHLKDFQIIALLGEDALGALGVRKPQTYILLLLCGQLQTTTTSLQIASSVACKPPGASCPMLFIKSVTLLDKFKHLLLQDYEYNYDYSDLTVKPNNSTSAPLQTSPSSSVTPLIETTTPKPFTTTTPKPFDASSLSPNTTQQLTNVTSSKQRSEDAASTSTEKPVSSEKKTQKVTSVTILPSESTSHAPETSSRDSFLNLGEILHYRRCPSGYSRDKRGRCRRTRKPVIP